MDWYFSIKEVCIEMNDDVKIIEIDIRGQICPSTLLVSLKEINNNQFNIRYGNTELHILTDNRDAITTVPYAAKSMGYEVFVEKTEERFYRIIIKK